MTSRKQLLKKSAIYLKLAQGATGETRELNKPFASKYIHTHLVFSIVEMTGKNVDRVQNKQSFTHSYTDKLAEVGRGLVVGCG